MEHELIQAPRRVPRKLDENSDTKQVLLHVPTSLTERVDEWRRRQPDIPNKSEAFRRLVELALDREEKNARR